MADGNLFCLGGVGVIFMLIALSVAISAIKGWKRYQESDNWIPITAEIISADISSHKGTKSTTYFVNITYAYEVFGQPYQSGQFSFGSEGTGGKSYCEISAWQQTDDLLRSKSTGAGRTRKKI
jgi:hypothetical protein